MHTELRWTQRPFAELLHLAWPIAVSMLSHSIMTVADTLFVSGIGASALAGVGIAGIVMFTLLCFSVGLLRGVKVLVSQAVGAQRPRDAAGYLSAGLVLAAALGLFTCAVLEIAAPLLHHLAASVQAGDFAVTYLRLRVLSAPTLLLFVALRESCYGRGDARAPMVASISANIVNIALDYVFVVWCGWAVAGVAWASVAASAIEMAVLFWARSHDLRALPRVRLRHIVSVWRVGLPTGAQFLLEVGSLSLLTVMLSILSEIQMAAHQIVLHLLHFSFLPTNAVAEAGSVLAGQAVGANRDDLVLGVARRSMIAAGAYTALCTLIILLAARLIVGTFTDDDALADVAVNLMYIAAVFLVADGANMVARGILRGTGDVRYPAVICIVCAWLFTPPLTWLLGYRAGLGAAGGWLGLCVEIMACAAILWWRLGRGHWRTAARRSRNEMTAADPSTTSRDSDRTSVNERPAPCAG